ncbi:MAG: hypothetical protein Kapaf2KO_08190 [Candidatus Kapaibacteriales bacterium]
MKKHIIFITTLCSLFFASCEEKAPPEEKRLDGYIEEGLLPLFDTLINVYEAKDMNVDIALKQADTYEAFRQLLSGRAPLLISSRTYTPREDSLMAAHEMDSLKRIAIAHDALVLVTRKDFPLDTINHLEIAGYLSDKEYSLAGRYEQLSNEPKFLAPDSKSSVFASVSRHIFRYEPIVIEGRFANQSGSENIVQDIKDGVADIGFAFLSQVAKDTTVSLLPVGYNSDDIIGEDQVKEANEDLGKGQIYPKPVHQAYVTMRVYPYIVTHWVYLQKDKRLDNYFYFARYLAEGKESQRYFNEAGIQPEHAKIKLIPQ